MLNDRMIDELCDRMLKVVVITQLKVQSWRN